MVDEKKHPPGDAVGLLPDGKINIGTPEQMRARFEEYQAESTDATEQVKAALAEKE